MLKPALLALAGLAATVPAAIADTNLPLLPRPELGHDFDPFAAPAPNHGTVDLCGRFGVACSIPFAAPRDGLGDLGDLAELLPLAQADAAKRWALHVEQWARIADLSREGRPHSAHPLSNLPTLPDGFGWRPDRMADIMALMDDVQDRLAEGPAPRRALPLWLHPQGPHFEPFSVRPAPGPQLHGQSILILPRH